MIGHPRTNALMEQIRLLGYSAADQRCTSLCWALEEENGRLSAALRAVVHKAAAHYDGDGGPLWDIAQIAGTALTDKPDVKP